ncbi:hypothetical protein [Microlunatus sp. Y2014]|uniref:hypothetical protein n=1 Tax=Microlunatus sp. Y2014 TaxID=3418488 RepID=UPI003DA759F0
MTQQPAGEPWLEPTDDDLVKRGEYPYQRADQVELHGDTAAPARRPDSGRDLTPAESADMARLHQQHQFVLGIVSLGTGIPLTAIAATNVEPGLLGIAVAWAGIVAVNLAHAVRGRRRDR